MSTERIDNHLARNIPHVHPEAEPGMEWGELVAHLVKYHGWPVVRFTEPGGRDRPHFYSWHDAVHAGNTQPVDVRLPEEW